MYLSKSDYMLADNCLKALWLKKNRKDLDTMPDTATQNRFDTGNIVQELARTLFPNGVLVPAESWDVTNGAALTKMLTQTKNVLFEAFAQVDNKIFCRIDIMIKTPQGWDLIEIKSSTAVKEEHLNDLAFQRFVFENAGYEINRCVVMHLNSAYVRQGEINVNELFKLVDVTEAVLQRLGVIPEFVERYWQAQHQIQEPQASLKASCKNCPYYGYCAKDMPPYSIFDLLRQKQADAFYNTYHSFEIADLPETYCHTEKQLIDRNAFLTGAVYTNPALIRSWLERLVYPLYYLDYETVQTAVPLFDNSRPYSQIPFQFSLHIQEKKGGAVEHIGFLHKQKSDPRRELASFLVQSCGQNGSIVVYNENFEKTRNKELADLFPDLRNPLLALNERVIDQLVPFRHRALYSPKQKSSASIKYVLPAFCDLSYKDMEVKNGTEAMTRYQAFLEDKLNQEAEQILFDGLEKYCHQDTLAMVKLMDVLYHYAESEE